MIFYLERVINTLVTVPKTLLRVINSLEPLVFFLSSVINYKATLKSLF